jgi:hypothetical protein
MALHSRCIALVFISSALTLCAAARAGAQEEPRFRPGLLGQVGLSQFSTSGPSDQITSWASRPGGGLSLDIGLGRVASLDLRALYLQKGERVRGTDPSAADAHVTIGYIAVPLLMKVKAPGRVRPYLAAGPEIDFRTSAKGAVSFESIQATVDVSDHVAKTDVALDFGAGVEIPIKKTSFFGEGIFSYGVKNISTEAADSVDDRVRTRSFQFNVGVRF